MHGRISWLPAGPSTDTLNGSDATRYPCRRLRWTLSWRPQVTAAMRLADGVMLVVDAAEGIMVVTERAVRQALQEGLSITLMISKVGRARGAI